MFYKTNVHRENTVSVVETDNCPSLRYAYTENATHYVFAQQRIDFKAFTPPPMYLIIN